MAAAKKAARKAAPKKAKTLPQSKSKEKRTSWGKYLDGKLPAKHPGYRKSKQTGKIYKEVRPNRSDV